MADSDMTSAAPRTGGLGTVLLAVFAFLYLGSAAGAALDESTTRADERRLMDTTMADSDDITSAAARSGGLGTVLLAFLALLFVGTTAGAAVDESTTMADERRLADTTMADDITSPAAPRAAFRTAPLLAIVAALGLAARR